MTFGGIVAGVEMILAVIVVLEEKKSEEGVGKGGASDHVS